MTSTVFCEELGSCVLGTWIVRAKLLSHCGSVVGLRVGYCVSSSRTANSIPRSALMSVSCGISAGTRVIGASRPISGSTR